MMKRVLFCMITVLLIAVLCFPLLSATGAPNESGSYKLGDVDGDGQVTMIDATIIQRVLAHLLNDDDGMYTKRGDVDGDGKLTAADVTWIQRWLAHMSTPYAVGEVITPTEPETLEPTEEPTEAPVVTEAPTDAPTEAPTVAPTQKKDPYELPPI
ncbi:MAG: dockerin type I repeat-containing protein [Ruminococcus sp.]|nr:dockerin type I repeat-containing protein [Ruminococcus sp.]